MDTLKNRATGFLTRNTWGLGDPEDDEDDEDE